MNKYIKPEAVVYEAEAKDYLLESSKPTVPVLWEDDWQDPEGGTNIFD